MSSHSETIVKPINDNSKGKELPSWTRKSKGKIKKVQSETSLVSQPEPKHSSKLIRNFSSELSLNEFIKRVVKRKSLLRILNGDIDTHVHESPLEHASPHADELPINEEPDETDDSSDDDNDHSRSSSLDSLITLLNHLDQYRSDDSVIEDDELEDSPPISEESPSEQELLVKVVQDNIDELEALRLHRPGMNFEDVLRDPKILESMSVQTLAELHIRVKGVHKTLRRDRKNMDKKLISSAQLEKKWRKRLRKAKKEWFEIFRKLIESYIELAEADEEDSEYESDTSNSSGEDYSNSKRMVERFKSVLGINKETDEMELGSQNEGEVTNEDEEIRNFVTKSQVARIERVNLRRQVRHAKHRLRKKFKAMKEIRNQIQEAGTIDLTLLNSTIVKSVSPQTRLTLQNYLTQYDLSNNASPKEINKIPYS